MKHILRNIIASFVLALVLIPTAVFANTDFKGTETVNINKADAPTLAAYLKGVGAAKATPIVKYRKAHGKFKSIEDLKNVDGIGDATIRDNKRKLSTSRGKSSAPEGYKMGKASSSSKKSSKKKPTKKKSSTSKSTSSSSSSSSSSKKSASSSSSSSSSKAKKAADKKDSKASKTKIKSKLDQQSAAYILQGYLDRYRNN